MDNRPDEPSVRRIRPAVGACGGGTHRIDYEQRPDGDLVYYLDYLKLWQALDAICRRGRSPIAEKALGL